MNIKYVYKSRGEKKQKLTSLDEFCNQVKNCKYQKLCDSLKYKLGASINLENTKLDETERLPHVFFSLGKGYTGLVMLSFRAEGGWADNYKFLASALPQTLLCFAGSSDRTLKIIVPFALPDGSLPTDDKDILMFHQTAYVMAAKFYESELGTQCEAVCPGIENGCCMSCDESIFYNPNAVKMVVSEPYNNVQKPDKLRRSIIKQTVMAPHDMLPDFDLHQMSMIKYLMCYRNVVENGGYEDTDELLTMLAKECQHNGLEEEFAVSRTLRYAFAKDIEIIVRNCFRNVYDVSIAPSSCVVPKPTIDQARLRQFLFVRYAFRRNSMTGDSEYHTKDSYIFSWHPLTKEVYNTMTINAKAEGIDAWDKDIKRFVESTFVESFDPIMEYISALPEWDGEERIERFAMRVQTDFKGWAQYFHLWFLGMVSQWMGRNVMHGNSMVPMLVGAQGDGKSTFCRMILPEELLVYYTDRVDFAKRNDAVKALTRFLLVNIDEYDSISKRQTAFLKYMLSTADVKYRNLYESIVQQHQRYAAFVATTNNPQPLTDSTGSRRYMCVQVNERIDTSTTVDYPQLYAQAVAEIRAGMKTYFDNEDEQAIQISNGLFQQYDCIDEIFSDMFHRPLKTEVAIRMTVTEIVGRMKEKYKNIELNKSNIMRVGHILRNGRYKFIRNKRLEYFVGENVANT